ncbi:MAG: MFS transporter [Aeromicrobium sp.]
MVLVVPALLTTAVVVVIHLGVARDHEAQPGELDRGGLALLSANLLLITGGLILVRTAGAGSPWPWLAFVAGAALLWPFGRWELRSADPLVDLRVLRQPSMWPVQLTAFLFGVSVLGAQMPLSTFAQTNPDEHGFGLGMDSSSVAPLIGAYVLSMLVGALLFARVSRAVSPRGCLIGAAGLIALGYTALTGFHDSALHLVVCMIVVGLGSGALVAALPAAAAAAAPEGRTAVATGLTNATKTVGGAFASAVFGVATAAVAAFLLMFVPKLAFADPEPDPDSETMAV